MNWEKKGLIFNVENYKNEYIYSHASIPYAHHVSKDLFRIYFSSRNENGKSLPYFIEAVIKKSKIEIVGQPVGPLLSFGPLGTFDDSGIMPSCMTSINGKLYMYYIGWNPQITVSYRLSIGLAISLDNGLTFKKYSLGPICDRNIMEPYFNTAPYVLKEESIWKMWYISCTKWQIINNYPEPSYHVKYAESQDGINWNQLGIVCIDYDEKAEAIGRPCVFKDYDIYKMYFSYRTINKYRISKEHGYKIGYAESIDGINWKKKYEKTGIKLSANGWDSMMMEYCHIFIHNDQEFMIYNGNDFGKEGFGYAIK